MRKVNFHEVKTQLASLLTELEATGVHILIEAIRVYRSG
jgi:hypothetical protein